MKIDNPADRRWGKEKEVDRDKESKRVTKIMERVILVVVVIKHLKTSDIGSPKII